MYEPGAFLHEPLVALVAGEPLLALPDIMLPAQVFDQGLATGEPLTALVTGVQRVALQMTLVRQLHREAGAAVRTDQSAHA